MSCPDCAALAAEIASLTARVAELDEWIRELRDRERDLSMALAQAPKVGERFRDTPRYSTWYLGVRWKALHDTDTPSRQLTEPPSYAASFPEKRKPGRRSN